MASRRVGDKPLSESTLTLSTDAYMRHEEDMSWYWEFIGNFEMLYYLKYIQNEKGFKSVPSAKFGTPSVFVCFCSEQTRASINTAVEEKVY